MRQSIGFQHLALRWAHSRYMIKHRERVAHKRKAKAK